MKNSMKIFVAVLVCMFVGGTSAFSGLINTENAKCIPAIVREGLCVRLGSTCNIYDAECKSASCESKNSAGTCVRSDGHHKTIFSVLCGANNNVPCEVLFIYNKEECNYIECAN